MQKFILILSFILPMGVFGQINIINLSLTDSTKSVLYRYEANTLKVTGIKNETKFQLISNSKNYIVDSTKNKSFCIFPRNIKTDTLKIIIDDSIVFTKRYDCLLLPDPIAIFAATQSHFLSKAQIMRNPYISVILPDCLYKLKYFIIRYEVYFLLFSDPVDDLHKRKFKTEFLSNHKLTYKKVDESLVVGRVTKLVDSIYTIDIETGNLIAHKKRNNSKTVYDPRLNEGHIAIINRMQSGDMILFKDITARASGGADRRLNDIVIKITD